MGRMHGPRRGLARAALSAATVALLAGCATSARQPIATANPSADPGEPDWVWSDADEASEVPNTGLAALAAQAAEEIQAYQQGNLAADPVAEPSVPALRLDHTSPQSTHPVPKATNEPANPRPSDGLLLALSIAGDGPALTTDQTEPAASAPANSQIGEPEDDLLPVKPGPSRSMRIAQLSSELAELLKQESQDRPDPVRPLLAAALLESVASGVVDEIDLPGGGALMLTESEREALKAVRQLAVRLVGQGDETAGDPQRLRDVMLSTAEQLRPMTRLRIGAAELCSKAPGFGNYVPLPRRTFLAGRPNRVVVYAEIENFALRPAISSEVMTEGDTVAAQLTEQLELYLRAGDPSPTWQREIQWLPRTSRHSFDDLFLATTIDLPATLSVGTYDLKVRVIDEVTGAQDEAIIPIRLVADASALDEEPSDDTPPEQGDPDPSILLGGR
ncbi:MAG TPA: hypothetical protein ENJ00_11535 [Phycisphaerales bacterium]|nr:hypothetical protein [Phycisphaerales bacterium]